MMEALKGVFKERNTGCVLVSEQLSVTCFQACLHGVPACVGVGLYVSTLYVCISGPG